MNHHLVPWGVYLVKTCTMDQQVLFQQQPLHYRIAGSGNPIVFLHGYLESKEIWGSFPERFADSLTE